jgi:hypothetical protein
MSPIPYYIVVNKPNKQMKLEQKFVHNVGTDLEDIKNKLVYVLQEEFQPFQDIPEEYDEFVSKCWYLHYSADVEPFEYKLFYQGKWTQPWEPEELYEKVYDVLHKLELLGAMITDANKDEEEYDERDEEAAEE